ncbi:hypothetical protein SFR_6465 [Streptomyces sp. FR-008]|nr:hypothetical protein SFR_6465 [Streptomyces sp. FR-008]
MAALVREDPSGRQAPAAAAGRSGRTPSPAAVRTTGRHRVDRQEWRTQARRAQETGDGLRGPLG